MINYKPRTTNKITDMENFSISSLAKIVNAKPAGDFDGQFAGVGIDSRTIKTGDCFFAIAGENFDGHDYIDKAFANGAVCAVISQPAVSKFASRKILQVDDTIKALGCFAREYRRQKIAKVVGITGSVGKTTTRQIIYHVLSRYTNVLQSPKNFNNTIGLPLTLLSADKQHQVVIAELGSNLPGEIAYLTDIAKPDIAIITNVHPSHLAGFGDLQTITREKISIQQGLTDKDSFLINGDCIQLTDFCHSRDIKFTSFGKSDSCDIRAENIIYKAASSSFTINGTEIELPLAGPGNVENTLAAWAVCSRLGIKARDFAQAVKTAAPPPMRAQLMRIGSLTVLNDCYNANPASMKNALDIIANLSSVENKRAVFICGDMGELGTQTQQLHTQLGDSIAHANVQLLIAVGDTAKIAAMQAKRAAGNNFHCEYFKDTFSVCNNLENLIKNSDIVLVKGSRVAGLEATVEKLEELFS